MVNWPFVLRPAAHLDLEVEAGGNLGVSHKADYDRRGAWTADDPFIWSLAFSHDLRNGTSRGIMDGVTDIALEDIANRLENPHPKWSKHPVYLVLILLDVSMEHTLWDVNRLGQESLLPRRLQPRLPLHGPLNQILRRHHHQNSVPLPLPQLPLQPHRLPPRHPLLP